MTYLDLSVSLRLSYLSHFFSASFSSSLNFLELIEFFFQILTQQIVVSNDGCDNTLVSLVLYSVTLPLPIKWQRWRLQRLQICQPHDGLGQQKPAEVTVVVPHMLQTWLGSFCVPPLRMLTLGVRPLGTQLQDHEKPKPHGKTTCGCSCLAPTELQAGGHHQLLVLRLSPVIIQPQVSPDREPA